MAEEESLVRDGHMHEALIADQSPLRTRESEQEETRAAIIVRRWERRGLGRAALDH